MRREVRALLVLAALFSGCTGTSGPPLVTPAIVASARGEKADLQTLNAGRNVFVNRCIECHVLPSINEHPASAWPGLVSKMSTRADLTKAEHEALLAYILAVHSQ